MLNSSLILLLFSHDSGHSYGKIRLSQLQNIIMINESLFTFLFKNKSILRWKMQQQIQI